jgi:hypothetical protein
VHSIGLAVVHKDPKCILLSDSIRGTRVKRGGFRLGNLLNFTVKLGRRSLVELDILLHSTGTDGIKHAKNTNSITVSGVLGHVEGNLNMTHGTEVIDFVGADICDNSNKICGITKISIVKEKLYSSFVLILVDVINTASVERGGTADDSMNLHVTLKKNIDERRLRKKEQFSICAFALDRNSTSKLTVYPFSRSNSVR